MSDQALLAAILSRASIAEVARQRAERHADRDAELAALIELAELRRAFLAAQDDANSAAATLQQRR